MTRPTPAFRRHQRGAAMLEFTVVGPVVTLLGLACLQYGLLFFAKNQINHATFMAARAGSTGNADPGRIQDAFARALIPLYGGGTDAGEIAAAYAKASADVAANSRIELLNPTRESFDDWNDPGLQNSEGGGRRVIPNGGLAFKDPGAIGAASGQNIQDANLARIRVTLGFAPKIPFMGLIYTKYLALLDPGTDPFRSQLIARGLIPIVAHATVQMQSDAIEPDSPVSPPGDGESPASPEEPPADSPPDTGCGSGACTQPTPPLDPGTGGCAGDNCTFCQDAAGS